MLDVMSLFGHSVVQLVVFLSFDLHVLCDVLLIVLDILYVLIYCCVLSVLYGTESS